MTPATCDIHPLLEAFADGELTGVDRLRVATHLDTCDRCTADLEAIAGVGAALRAAAASLPTPPLSGLADGVVTRVAVETEQSWRGALDRAIRDWRWAIVGSGSVAATFVSTLLVWAVVGLTPMRDGDDSLAARMNNLGSRAGVLSFVAKPVGGSQDSTFTVADSVATRSRGESSSESALISQLAQWVVTRDGRIVDINAMQAPARRDVESLLDRMMTQLQYPETAPRSSYGELVVSEVRLAVNTGVSAKGL
jgi:anti-sigma factor RsiW